MMVRDGTLITPSVTADILEGVTRATLLQLAAEELGIPVKERAIDRTELYICDEAFFCGTGVQICAITSIDNRPVGNGLIGPITQRLRALYFDIVRGKVRKYKHWCTPVYDKTAGRDLEASRSTVSTSTTA
jgi:branched-chain amino acid aminotransferase